MGSGEHWGEVGRPVGSGEHWEGGQVGSGEHWEGVRWGQVSIGGVR